MRAGFVLKPSPDICSRLIDAVSTSLALAAGVGSKNGFVEECRDTIGEAVSLYLEHPHWPTYLTDYGPVEICVNFGGPKGPQVRYLADIADHRFRISGNWMNMVKKAITLSGSDEAAMTQLFASHLQLNPPTTRSQVYHGIGYGTGNLRRTTLYFVCGGASRSTFADKFGSPIKAAVADLQSAGGDCDPAFHSVSYDFGSNGALRRSKYYAWLDRDRQLHSLESVFGRHGELALPIDAVEDLRKTTGVSPGRNSIMLQSSMASDSQAWRHKIYLACRPWQLESIKGQKAVLELLSRRFGTDLSLLYAVLDAFLQSGIRLMPTWVALGPNSESTFYFAPLVARELAGNVEDLYTQSKIGLMIKKGIDYLASLRLPDGSWSDDGQADTPYWLTARIALALTELPEGSLFGKAAVDWLSSSAEKADAISGLLAELAALRMGSRLERRLPTRARKSIEEHAMELMIGAQQDGADAASLSESFKALERNEIWTGGWTGVHESLLVTTMTVEALLVVAKAHCSYSERAYRMIARARYCYTEVPVRGEPARLAIWLKGWLLCGQDGARSSVVRALGLLAEMQLADGSWPASPYETAIGDSAYYDSKRLLTTAQVIVALSCLREKLA
jgi:hypothetical protein